MTQTEPPVTVPDEPVEPETVPATEPAPEVSPESGYPSPE